MAHLHHMIAVGSLLLLVSVLASKVAERFGVPVLLLFLGIGMLAGSDGPGGIAFSDAPLAQSWGVAALAVILFAGGLATPWPAIRPVFWSGLSLSTLGVAVSTALVGGFASWTLHVTWLEGLLLGAIVSATDAAAVFSVLKSKKIGLQEPLVPLLELEAGSNDPMSVFLTLAFLQALTHPGYSAGHYLGFFLRQMALGGVLGFGFGRIMIVVVNRIRLNYDGLYPALVLAMALFTYGATASLDGNGFLAIYVAGVVMGRQSFVHKAAVRRFFDGLAWLMQIAMFIMLGLFVFPSRLPLVLGPGLIVALFLIGVARPASVFLSLSASALPWRQKAMVSWTGLRGAAPIILATFPLVAGVQRAELYFDLTFFIVLTSVLLQGPFIPWIATRLNVAVANEP